MNRTLVIGDLHGQSAKLIRLLELVRFNPIEDRVIFLGDYCDARKNGIESHNLVSTYLQIKSIPNKICLLGNHDIWCRDYLLGRIDEENEDCWLSQGGLLTAQEFKETPPRLVDELKNFFVSLVKYHEEDNFVCVHGGFYVKQKWIWPSIPEDICCWNRSIPESIQKGQVFKDLPKTVILGHTPTISLNKQYYSEDPIISGNIVLLDTGAGYGYKLSAYCVETKEIWSTY